MGGRSFGGKGRWKRRSLVPKNLPANNPFFFLLLPCHFSRQAFVFSPSPFSFLLCGSSSGLPIWWCVLRTHFHCPAKKRKRGRNCGTCQPQKKFSTRARNVLPFFQFSLFSSFPGNQVTFISSFIPRLFLPAAVIRIEQFVGGQGWRDLFSLLTHFGFRGFFFPLSPSPPLCADRPRNGNRQT